jgi:hypothetical protein
MIKAQKQTDKATPSEKGRSQSEEEKPDRTLKTAEDSRTAMTLPVVSESNESQESSRNPKRALSPPDETEEQLNEKTPPQSPSVPTGSSIPGLRKVSPSTVATATDMAGDDTSVSSPQIQGMDDELESHDNDDYSRRKKFEDEVVTEKPPRIASDLIQPHSPLEDSMFRSMDHRLRESGHGP